MTLKISELMEKGIDNVDEIQRIFDEVGRVLAKNRSCMNTFKKKKTEETASIIYHLEDDLFQSLLFGVIIRERVKELGFSNFFIQNDNGAKIKDTLRSINSKIEDGSLKLIILDLNLSKFSGFDLLNILPNTVPVIVLTADEDPETLEKLKKYTNVLKVIKKKDHLSKSDWDDVKEKLNLPSPKLVN